MDGRSGRGEEGGAAMSDKNPILEIAELTAMLDDYRRFAGLVRALLVEHDAANGFLDGVIRPDSPTTTKIRTALALLECSEPVRCDRCGYACGDFRQRAGERVCLLCVERELDEARAELALVARIVKSDQAERPAGAVRACLEELLCLLSTLVYWHEKDIHIDESWWKEARSIVQRHRGTNVHG